MRSKLNISRNNSGKRSNENVQEGDSADWRMDERGGGERNPKRTASADTPSQYGETTKLRTQKPITLLRERALTKEENAARHLQKSIVND